jgi:hypothetical protein
MIAVRRLHWPPYVVAILASLVTFTATSPAASAWLAASAMTITVR